MEKTLELDHAITVDGVVYAISGPATFTILEGEDYYDFDLESFEGEVYDTENDQVIEMTPAIFKEMGRYFYNEGGQKLYDYYIAY